MSLKVEELAIADVKLIKTPTYRDGRGTFSETWNQRDLVAAGICRTFVQDNHAVSYKAGTIRGLHFQVAPHAQGKLVRVTRGRIYDVAVDIRPESATFGQWVGKELAATSGEQLWVPAGFAHGYCTLEPQTEVIYKVDEYYAPAAECGIRWDDPHLDIDWPVRGSVNAISPKDRVLPTFDDWRRTVADDSDCKDRLNYEDPDTLRRARLRPEPVSP